MLKMVVMVERRLPLILWKGTWNMTQLPDDQHITYQLQYRKCGKATCSTCRKGQGHGPYWYAYWREGARLRSGYIGKLRPDAIGLPISRSNIDAPAPLVLAGSRKQLSEAVV